jgi:hypothetical protein
MIMERVRVFKEILQIILDAGFLDAHYISKKMDVNVGSVEDAISLLLIRGYLTEDEWGTAEPPACKGCSIASKCNTNETSEKIYRITEKGLRLAESST